MSNHDQAPENERQEILESIKLVYLGKEKVSKRMTRYYDDFWKASFEIGPDFKGSSEQKDQIYHAIAEVFGHMLHFSLELGSSKNKFIYEARTGGGTDEGGYVDVNVQKIMDVLNSPEAKKALSAYLDYIDAKKKVATIIK